MSARNKRSMPHTHEALITVINNLYYFSDSAFPVSTGSSGKDITGTSRSPLNTETLSVKPFCNKEN